MKKKKQWTHKEKFMIALAAIRGEQTITALCQQHQVSATQVYAWKKELLEEGAEIFNKKESKAVCQSACKNGQILGSISVQKWPPFFEVSLLFL